MKHTNPFRQPSIFIAVSLTLACVIALAASFAMTTAIGSVVPSAVSSGGDSVTSATTP
ncbi:hypothetical protein G7066_11975 [Leucobacter coleopterorum]|uniref:Uncharacterized protein n=1 Tax=Leucobacter coleopterorum TaxID=2714933 RepID=A0ABX6K236_9MICO|nr:hypothetical protein [Leucobacter coleopterorum]QIM19100.1 hypothetical protein G7066_11975 [Leucobacter coleopterorum]